MYSDIDWQSGYLYSNLILEYPPDLKSIFKYYTTKTKCNFAVFYVYVQCASFVRYISGDRRV